MSHDGYTPEMLQLAHQVIDQVHEGATHLYLSTGCLHGDHDHCQSMIGNNGLKRGAHCKFCDALCICGCHTAGSDNG
jgi:hypothetical protein